MRAMVTGGASFIGSHLVEALVQRGDQVTVIDDFSSGTPENLAGINVRHLGFNLRSAPIAPHTRWFEGQDIVYHLAADHGGRGYVEIRQVATSNNFALDNNVFQAARVAGVPKIIFASSGCVYPLYLQQDAGAPIFLAEQDVAGVGGHRSGYDPDGLYGLAKLAGELTLQQLYKEESIESVSCRFFTVYGPRAKENHAIMSFIGRAFIQRDPWVVWGDGHQVRNWTYVDDIVQGMLLAADRLSGCQALNIGTEEMITVDQAVEAVIKLANEREEYAPRIEHALQAPVGPICRVASNQKYRELGGTVTPFEEGLRRTMDWYYAVKDRTYVAADFDRLLIARK